MLAISSLQAVAFQAPMMARSVGSQLRMSAADGMCAPPTEPWQSALRPHTPLRERHGPEGPAFWLLPLCAMRRTARSSGAGTGAWRPCAPVESARGVPRPALLSPPPPSSPSLGTPVPRVHLCRCPGPSARVSPSTPFGASSVFPTPLRLPGHPLSPRPPAAVLLSDLWPHLSPLHATPQGGRCA